MIAQGNALGSWGNKGKALQGRNKRVAETVIPFQGDQTLGLTFPQGVALGFLVRAFQATGRDRGTPMPRYRLGIDIDGTFADATLLDEETGAIRIDKVSTTPADPARGFLEAAARLLRKAGVKPDEVRYVVHATTVATNAIIEGKIARTGFVTTEGFRDMLEIARQGRPSLYDLLFEKPRPLVPRQLCFGVPERLDAKGRVLVPLDEEAVRRVAGQLREAEVEAIAVCLLHSYVSPVHEKRVGEILREGCPNAVVSLSSEVAPEFREYRRASTTIINASIQPVVARYLRNLETRLEEADYPANFLAAND